MGRHKLKITDSWSVRDGLVLFRGKKTAIYYTQYDKRAVITNGCSLDMRLKFGY